MKSSFGTTLIESHVTNGLVCEQLAQSCYLIVDWPGVKPVNLRLLGSTR